MVAAARMNMKATPSNDSKPNRQCSSGSTTRWNGPSLMTRPSSIYSERVDKMRKAIYYIMEEPDSIKPAKGTGKTISNVIAVIVLSMIVLSIVCFVLETEPALSDTPELVWKAVEIITTSTFTIEYLVRLWVCDVFGTSMLNWVFRPMNVCDLLAISPMYAEFFLNEFTGMEVLRVLRVVRLFKLGRYSQGVKVMSAALMNSMSALNILIFLFFIGVIIFSAAVYFTEKLSCPVFKHGSDMGIDQFRVYTEECEESSTGVSTTYGTCCSYQCLNLNHTEFPVCRFFWHARQSLADSQQRNPLQWQVEPMHEKDFTSIPVTMWWAAVTMTTVGYGDYVPKNWVSKVVGSIAMISGMLIIAMPFAIVGAKFGEAVATYEDPDVSESRMNNLKQAPVGTKSMPSAAMLAPSRSSLSGIGSPDKSEHSKKKATGMKQAELSAALHPDKFHVLQAHCKESLELKTHILKLNSLRDNLWTSIEHSMAAFAYEGIMSLENELVAKPIEIQPWLVVGGNPKFCEWSCHFFRRDKTPRRQCIWLTQEWVWFDRFVLLLIIANSVILALHDYYPRAEKPWTNVLDESTETLFICLFTAECVTKVIAVGFICHGKAYLHEAWNWLDFIVVVTGWLTLVISSNDSDFTFLRTIRVLRPLRTLSTMPGMRALVNTVLSSLPRLKDVMLMAVFLLMTFGILGLHFWGGVMHRLCRVTPQPLHFVPNLADLAVGACKGWCFDNHSIVQIDLGDYRGTRNISSAYVFDEFCKSSTSDRSPCELAYSRNQDYFLWPADPNQDRFCGSRECSRVDPALVAVALTVDQLRNEILLPMGVQEHTTALSPGMDTYCGNDFDSDTAYGAHTVNPQLKGVNMDHWEKVVFQESYNWGLTRYDTLASAMLVIFQCVTLEGWVEIMYMLEDAFSPSIFAFVYFVTLVIIGSFFLLNVTLAIVWDAFQSIQEGVAADQSLAGDETPMTGCSTLVTTTEQPTTASQFGIPEQQNSTMNLLAEAGIFKDSSIKRMYSLRSMSSINNRIFSWLPRRHRRPMIVILFEEHPSKIINWSRALARHPLFSSLVMATIGANVLVLSFDKYPNPILHASVADMADVFFNVIFIMEFVILHIAYGVVDYWCDKVLAFDGAIVLLSTVDMFLVATASGNGGGSGLAAMRAFRLLRVFKLAQRFPTMKALLAAIIETLMSMRDFVFLLCLIIVVFALIGQSFFGGKFMFDGDSGCVISVADQPVLCPFDVSGKPNCVPRAHFDTFLWGCVTVFQILTGENWNAVMYDGMKASGWLASFYFICVVVFGNFVILNLFLAILMMNFESAHEKIQELQKEQRKAGSMIKKEMNQMRKLKSGPLSGELVGASAALFKLSGAMAKRSRSDPKISPEPEVDRASKQGSSEQTWAQRSNSAPAQRSSSKAGSVEEASDLVVENMSEASCHLRSAEPSPESPGSMSSRAEQTLHPHPNADGSHSPNTLKLPSPDRPSPSLSAGSSSRVELEEDIDDEVVSPKYSVFSAFTHSKSTRSGRSGGATRFSLSQVLSLEKLTPDGIVCIWDNSLFVFSPENPLRDFCKRMDEWRHFNNTILVAIIVSSALMMLQNPLHNPDAALPTFLFWIDFVFTIIFTFEMVVKVVARGLLFGKGQRAYLMSAWNVVDGSIVSIALIDTVVSLMSTGDDSGILGIMKIFRIARVLRPLRLISRNENLKVVVRTIYSSIPELRDLVLFSIIFFLIFGLLGVSLFKGSFYRCKSAALESYAFNAEMGETPLCIPTVPISSAASNASSMRFVTPETACDQLSGHLWQKWKRPTPSTPICEVHCEDNFHPFCENTKPWGYHIMRCGDCEQTFCTTGQGSREDCKAECTDHQYFCSDKDSACIEECISSCMCDNYCAPLSEDAALCVEQGGRWINFNQHFNNILESWVSLFEISTTEGWVDMMYAAVDSRGPMKEPRRDSRPFLACAIFVAFILVGTFFVLNLCVGVIINNYHVQLELRGNITMTSAQRKWVVWQKALYTRRRFFLQTNLHLLSPTRQHLVSLVTSSMFDSVIMASIVANTLIMGMQIHPTPADPFNQMLETGNQVFALVFNGEAIMKLSAMHLNYFHDSWNRFDFLCVFAGDVILIIEGTVGSNNSLGQTVSIFRIFRIARLFRLVRFLKGLNQLVRAFVLSVPKLLNVGLIMGLLIYLYAILGVSLFAKIGYLDGFHSEQANFRNFPAAVSVLVRSMTGEAWNEIMHELSKSRFYMESYMDVACYETFAVTASNFASLDLNGDGVVDAPSQCGGAFAAYIYFITFTLSVTFVILNLFIAVILDGFEESQHNEIADIIYKSLEVWKKYDPECTMQLPLEKALDYIDEVVEAVCKKGAADEALKVGREGIRPSDKHSMGRYDSMYTGEIKGGVHSFAYYNLQYMRVLNLRVGGPSTFEVRFVVVVKAILRRLVCQCVGPEGGIEYHGQSKARSLSNLADLEALEVTMQGSNEPLKAELVRLKALERRQQRLNVDYTAMLPTRLHRAQHAPPGRQSSSGSSDGRSSAPLPVSSELVLVEEVAAAKIQRRIKELLQKRRARHAERPLHGRSASRPGSSYGPITRAAG